MAIFKLGSIITNISGSIGGTTFRRGVNNFVMQRKSFGGSRNKLLQNKRLGEIRYIFTSWKELDQSTKDNWNDVAPLYTFLDKFGVPKVLTGRQLYTKLNIQQLPLGTSVTDANSINSNVPVISIEEIISDFALQDLGVRVSAVPYDCKILVQANLSNLPNAPIIFNRSEVVGVGSTVGSGLVDLSAKFFARYPYATAESYVTVYVTPINQYGFKGATLVQSQQLS